MGLAAPELLKKIVGSFGLEIDVQIEGSITDSRCDILEYSNFANTYRQSQIIES
jgi:hypothetical protein